MADHLGEGENFTRISNEILEALAKAKLNGTQYAICLVVCRKTFGFQCWGAKISAGYISEVTGVNLRHVKRELQELADRQIILKVEQRDGVTSTLSFNRDISLWQPVTKKSPVDNPVTNPSLALVTKKSPEPVTNPSPNKLKRKKKKEKGSNDQADRTPYQKIINLYHELCPSLSKVITISENRKTHTKARWLQYEQNIEIFKTLFVKAEESDFLTHRVPSKNPKYANFKADFDWLINETNMAKVLEGKYYNRGSPITRETPEEKMARISRELEDEQSGSETSGHNHNQNSYDLPEL